MIKFICRMVLGIVLTCTVISCTAETQAIENKEEDNDNEHLVIENYDYSIIEVQTLQLINKYRTSNGLDSLEIINHLSIKSEEHNRYMIEKGKPSHDDFVNRSQEIIHFLGAEKVAENIGYNYRSAEGAVNGWASSPDHNEVMLGDFDYFGISIRENQDTGKKYFTNIFIKL